MTPTPVTPITEPNYTAGIIAMVAAMACFIFSDIFSKLATESLPVGEVIALRGMFSLLLFLVPAIAFGYLRFLRQHLSWPWLIRIAGEMGAALTFISALAHMPIANVTSITQSIPLAMTAAGALILGEQVGVRRWAATAIGFVGVLLIMRPGTSDFSWWSVAALGTVISVVIRDIATRKMERSIPAILITATTAAGVTLAGLGLGLTETQWYQPEPRAWVYLFCGAAAVAGGYYFSIKAVQIAPLSAVAPFRYTIIPMSLVAGFVVWDQIPKPNTFLGTAIIVAAGLYTFLRERVKKSATPAPVINQN